MNTNGKQRADRLVPATDPLLSMQVGEFVIRERIGSGGMGVVYRADHPLIGKQVAIKVLRAELVSEQQVERLLIEARAVNAIRHPGIIDIFGFGSLQDSRPYIIMELLHGHPLSEHIRQQGRLDIPTTVWILDQMMAALGAAHRAGVVHRDLKPGNVFIAEGADGTCSVKLVDFGIAKLVQSHDSPITTTGAILGTPEFMAPEQIRNTGVSPATDLYAVGISAFQMLTGTRPFNGEPFQVLFAQVEQPPPLPSSRVPGIPPELDTLVLQLLSKEPGRRPESAEAVRQALRRIPAAPPSKPMVRQPEIPSTSPREEQTRTTPFEVTSPLPVTRRGHQWVAGMALLAGLCSGAYLLWPEPPANAPAAAATSARPQEAAPPEQKVREPVASEVPATNKQAHQGAPPSEVKNEGAAPKPSASKPGTVVLPPPAVPVARTSDEVPASKSMKAATDKPLAATGQTATQAAPRELAGAPAGEDGRATQAMPVSSQASPPERLTASLSRGPASSPPPQQRRQTTLPYGGPRPTNKLLDRKLADMELRYLRRLAGAAPVPDLEAQLLQLYEAAVKAGTEHEYAQVQTALDAWKQRLDQQGQRGAAAPPPASRPMADAIPPSAQPSEKLQQNLLTEIQHAEQELRARVGDLADGSPALTDLQTLRLRAQATTKPEELITLGKELTAWKHQRLRRGTGAAP